MFAPRPDPASGEAWLGEGASTLVNWKFKHYKALGICDFRIWDHRFGIQV